ncbi:tandem-type lipoprotein [Staphylococcus aureus]|uniref:tandem-type lipoprotein n=1 Tax=Staphylococcus aureus TaxID=1280 RepID=UPI0004F2D3DF|nr:tandem-type lipoprotein [Staphylococcus aureus]
MGYSKRFALYISVMILIFAIAGCGKSDETKEGSKEEQIKKSFAKTLDMYPIKNLEDLYDKEGYRDGEFKKGDKGSYFSIEEIDSRKSLDERETEKKYPVKMINNKIIPTEEIKDEKLKKEIENFKFFSQYGDFKELKNYKNGEVSYNSEAPIYSAKYQLKNNDYNVKQLRKRYDISTEKAPKLLLKGTGDLKGSSIGHKDIEFTFVENQEENIFFTDSLEFTSSENY